MWDKAVNWYQKLRRKLIFIAAAHVQTVHMSVFLWPLSPHRHHGGSWSIDFPPFHAILFKYCLKIRLAFNSVLFRSTAVGDWIGSLPQGHYEDKKYSCNWPLEGSEPTGQTHTDSAICKAAKASAQQHYRARPDVIWQNARHLWKISFLLLLV